jgi:hypothetical protein
MSQSHDRSLAFSGLADHQVVSIRAIWAVEFPSNCLLSSSIVGGLHLEGRIWAPQNLPKGKQSCSMAIRSLPGPFPDFLNAFQPAVDL